MARKSSSFVSEYNRIISDIDKGVFAPFYLLMGDEPYYSDCILEKIIASAVPEEQADFNRTIVYGSDVSAAGIVNEARRYPVFAERQLVVVKEAQAMKSLEELALYCTRPLESTVLVIYMRGASADKRKSLYKSVSKIGVVVESNAVRDYEISRWISSYCNGLGLSVDPDAAELLGEYAGADLEKIALETGKLMKNLKEGCTRITASDIEKNVGVSRQFSIFELTRELSSRNAAKALRIAAYIGASPKFAMPMAVSALFTHFYRILKYEALLMKTPRPSNDAKARVLGVNPYFFREYDIAVANYPLKKCMTVIALLRDYDYKGKGGEAGEATAEQLLVELTARLLNV